MILMCFIWFQNTCQFKNGIWRIWAGI